MSNEGKGNKSGKEEARWSILSNYWNYLEQISRNIPVIPTEVFMKCALQSDSKQ